MQEQDKDRKEQYRHVRDAFDTLNIEDKALFLVEAAASTVARGLEEAGRKLGDELNRVFEEAEQRAAQAEHEDAEPDTPPSAAGEPHDAAEDATDEDDNTRPKPPPAI